MNRERPTLEDPLGPEPPDGEAEDGRVDVSATVHCPHCGESVEIALDPGGGAHQRYVEDCEICCRPWQVTVQYSGGGRAEVTVANLDE